MRFLDLAQRGFEEDGRKAHTGKAPTGRRRRRSRAQAPRRNSQWDHRSADPRGAPDTIRTIGGTTATQPAPHTFQKSSAHTVDRAHATGVKVSLRRHPGRFPRRRRSQRRVAQRDSVPRREGQQALRRRIHHEDTPDQRLAEAHQQLEASVAIAVPAWPTTPAEHATFSARPASFRGRLHRVQARSTTRALGRRLGPEHASPGKPSTMTVPTPAGMPESAQ